MNKKGSKYKEPIKLNAEISFDEAMERIMSTPAKEVEKGIKKQQEHKLLTTPTSKKLLPKPKK